jgi:hypothetical protein
MSNKKQSLEPSIYETTKFSQNELLILKNTRDIVDILVSQIKNTLVPIINRVDNLENKLNLKENINSQTPTPTITPTPTPTPTSKLNDIIGGSKKIPKKFSKKGSKVIKKSSKKIPKKSSKKGSKVIKKSSKKTSKVIKKSRKTSKKGSKVLREKKPRIRRVSKK